MMLRIYMSIIVVPVILFAMGGPALVETTTLKQDQVNPLQEFIGTVEFNKQSILAAQNAGVVQSIFFKVGQKVKKGQVLIQIDADLLNAQIKSLQARLNNALETQQDAQKNFLRYEKLLSTQSITQKEYDDTVLKRNATLNEVKSLQANLEELKLQSQKKKIKAPFSGVIVQKEINLGEWVTQGTPIAKLVDPSRIKVVVSVPLNILNGLDKKRIYSLQIGKERLNAKLAAIIPSGDRLTRTFPIEFQAKAKDFFLFNGQQAKVSLSMDAKQTAFIVPRDAVIKRFGQTVIFSVNEQNSAVMIPVQVINYLSDSIAILAQGLQEGMPVVVKGNERVFPNSPVKILNQ